MLKRYNDFIKESLKFDEDIDEDRVSISAYLNDKFIGKVVIEYVMSGYWEFENEITEERYDELFPDDKFAKIEYISIESEYTGKGYAKQLMNKALEDIKSKGEKSVYLNASPMGHNKVGTQGLVDFYKKFGFEIFIDDYTENKEMLLTLETVRAMGSTQRTIDAYLKIYVDEVKEREEEKEEERRKKREAITPDIIVDEFDEDTPELTTRMTQQEPTVRKNTSLGYGATNMP